MAEKNGGDIGAVYQAVQSLAGEMRAGVAEVRSEMRAGFAEVRSEMRRGHEKLETALEDVRHTLTDYHSAVVGHGILLSDLEARIRRLERHVGLPPES